jgi:SAM-dependent methyltransferase
MANWNERVPIHAASDLYAVKDLVSDPDHLSSIVDFDRKYLGDVSGKTLLHPQCHIGTDTLSWAKLGASVTGIDFSGTALDVARDAARQLGTEALFVESDLNSSPEVLSETFDIVYTGVGAICWMPSIARWAEIMAAFTSPGGTFYIREGHPVLWALDDERDDGLLSITEHYFERSTPSTWHEPDTYAGEGTLEHATIHSWNHGLAEIFTALTSAGFVVNLFEEHCFLEWQAFSHMIEVDGVWVLPEAQRDLVPLMYSIRATKS